MADITTLIHIEGNLPPMQQRVSKVLRAARIYDIVILASLLWFMVQFLRFALPPLFGTFQTTYGVSNTETGLLFTALMLAYSSMQFPAGYFADRVGEPRIIIAGAFLFGCAALVVSVSQTFTLIFVGVVLIGVGTGPHKTVAIPLLSNRYQDRTGLTLGFMDTIGQFGGTTAPLVVVIALNLFVWQSVFVFGAIISFVLGWLFYVRVKHDSELGLDGSTSDKLEADDNGPEQDETYWTVFSDRRLVVFVLVAMVFTFAWNAISAFFPLYLTSEKGFSGSVASLLYSVLFVASISQTVTGDISDRRDSIGVALALFACMVGAIVAFIVIDSLIVIAFATVIAGVGFHGFRPVRDSYLMDLLPQNVGSGAFGIVRTLMTGVGALAPAIVGFVSDVLGFIAAFSVIGGVLVLGGMLLTLLY